MRKEKNYILNMENGTLHYRGYCPCSKGYFEKVKLYDTEDDVYKDAGRAVRVCKNCMKNRENGKQKYT